MELETLRDHLRGLVTGKRIVLVGKPVDQYRSLARQFCEAGCEAPFVIANEQDGADPPVELGDTIGAWFPVELGGPSFSELARRTDALLQTPPAALLRALDAYDPDRSALVFADSAVSVNRLDGRLIVDGRLPAWARLEDKTVVDDLWRSVDIEHAPSIVCVAESLALANAHAEMDHGAGTVWSGDATRGINGTAELVRWVRSGGVVEATAFFAQRCDHVRIMPFFEGVPVGINAFVTPDGVAAFRPYEEVTLRIAGTSRFYHAGNSTYLDLAPEDREALRSIARVTGEQLRRRVGYRGAFTINGIQTLDGFFPTEINPRLGGGHRLMSIVLPDLLMPLIQAACVLEGPIQASAIDIAELVVDQVDARRGSAIAAPVCAEPETGAAGLGLVRGVDGTLTPAATGIQPHGYLAHVSIGRGGHGGVVTLLETPHLFSPGAFVAPEVVRCLRLADARWDTGIGQLACASRS